MSIFFRSAAVYFLAATALNFALRDDALMTALNFISLTVNVFNVFQIAFPMTVALLLASWVTSANARDFLRRLLLGLVMLAICCFFLAGFSSFKTLLPLMAEALGQPHFFADPLFASLDRTLHFGIDPWVFTHWLTEALGWTDFVHHSAILYGLLWAIPALYLPVILVLMGEDRPRQKHYLMLYLFSWIVLGNIFALAGLSAGPIYYDRIFGTELYTEMVVQLNAAGLEDSWFGSTQEGLWVAYSERGQAIGAGISAFPSMHVAMITVTALYMGEKNQWLGTIGWTLFGCVLFVSVWTGYHYAIDGYFSAIAVIAMHLILRRSSTQKIVSQEQSGARPQMATRSNTERNP